MTYSRQKLQLEYIIDEGPPDRMQRAAAATPRYLAHPFLP